MGGLKLGKEAAEKYAQAQKGADFEGFLEKKGAMRKNWNKRWFILKENYLFYTKKQGDPPQGIINLHGATINETLGPTTRPNSFSLFAPKSVSVDAKWTNRTFFICASSPEELKKWSAALVKASHFKNKASKVKEENSDKKSTEEKKEEKVEEKKEEKVEEKKEEKVEEKKEEKVEEKKKEEEKKEEEKKEEEKKEEKKKEEEKKEEKVEVKQVLEEIEEKKVVLELPTDPGKEDEKKEERRDPTGDLEDSESEEES